MGNIVDTLPGYLIVEVDWESNGQFTAHAHYNNEVDAIQHLNEMRLDNPDAVVYVMQTNAYTRMNTTTE